MVVEQNLLVVAVFMVLVGVRNEKKYPISFSSFFGQTILCLVKNVKCLFSQQVLNRTKYCIAVLYGATLLYDGFMLA
jgi:hypothetical membrane protein